MANALRLNLGAGEWRPPGWTSVDLNGEADVRHDLSMRPWPFESESAEQVLASHILEHFDRAAGVHFLAECRRVLRPNGLLHLAVPDMDLFIDCRNAADWASVGDYRWRNLDDLLGGGENEPRPEQRHRHMYNWASLAWTLERVGFYEIVRREPALFDNPDYRAISLYVSAER